MACMYATNSVEINRSILTQLGANSITHVRSPRIAVGESDLPASISGPKERSSNLRAASQRRVKLLLVGDDPDLLETRAMVLTSVGYDVASLTTAEALETHPFSRFDGMILCHSIPETKAVFLAPLMRKAKPQAHVIRLSMVPCPVPDSFTAVCGTMHSPVHFVADVEALLADRVV